MSFEFFVIFDHQNGRSFQSVSFLLFVLVSALFRFLFVLPETTDDWMFISFQPIREEIKNHSDGLRFRNFSQSNVAMQAT